MPPSTRSSRVASGTAQQSSHDLAFLEDELTPSTTSKRKTHRTFRRASPEPQLEQLKFPARKKIVRSKKASRSVEPTEASSLGGGKKNKTKKNKDPKQSTLTQIGWQVPSTFPEDEEEDFQGLDASLLGFAEDENADEETGRDGGRRRTKVASNRGRKRRKTSERKEFSARAEKEEEEDDDDDGHTDGGHGASSKYHTQTLTQMPSWRSSDQDEHGNDEVLAMVVADSDDEDGHVASLGSDKGTWHEQQETPQSKKRKRPSPAPRYEDCMDPQTPSKQRSLRTEIPSSQPSPFTPDFDISQRFWSPLALGVDRTPLKERSTNLDAPSPSIGSLKRSRSMVQDSWSTVNGGLGSSPTRSTTDGFNRAKDVKRTPLKEIHFVDVESTGAGDVSIELGEDKDALENHDPRRASQKSPQLYEEVIMDSDEEFEGFSDDEPEAPGTPSPSCRTVDRVVETDDRANAGRIGSTQLEKTAQHNAPSSALQLSTVDEPLATRMGTDCDEAITSTTRSLDVLGPEAASDENSPQQPCVVIDEIGGPGLGRSVGFMADDLTDQGCSRATANDNIMLQPAIEDEDTEPETPSRDDRRPSISSAVEKETPLSSPQKTSPGLPPVSQIGYSYKSQAFESQRVPFEIIRQMAPQTDRSDVIISISPDHVQKITEGAKTHEFRDYRLPQTVGRMWIYITRPVQQLKYMAIVSGYKLPGEVAADDTGIGNTEFNEGKGKKYAYELKQVYELNNPVSLERMKENGWVEQAPQKYEYVPPAVLGELMGNLRCALFEEHESGSISASQYHGQSQEAVTISQELAQQLRSDIEHTQLRAQISSSPHDSQQGRMQALIEDGASAHLTERESEDKEGDEEHISATPVHIASSSASKQQEAIAEPTGRLIGSQKRVQPGGITTPGRRRRPELQYQSQSQHIVRSTVRPSQATTASASSQSQLQEAKCTPERRTSRSQRSNGRNQNLERLPEDVLVVDDSPVPMRTARPSRSEQEEQTQSSLGLGLLLASSQGYGLGGIGGEQDSLLDDSRIRMPPEEEEVVWDSE